MYQSQRERYFGLFAIKILRYSQVQYANNMSTRSKADAERPWFKVRRNEENETLFPFTNLYIQIVKPPALDSITISDEEMKENLFLRSLGEKCL